MSNYKKVFKRVLAVLVAVALAVPMLTTGLAKAEGGQTRNLDEGEAIKNQVLHVHKLLRIGDTKLEELKDTEKGKPISSGDFLRNPLGEKFLKDQNYKEIPGVTFRLYKAKTDNGDKKDLTKLDNNVLMEAETVTVDNSAYATFDLGKSKTELKPGDYILEEGPSKYSEVDKTLGGTLAIPQRITLPLRDQDGFMPIANLYPKNSLIGAPVVNKTSKVTNNSGLDTKANENKEGTDTKTVNVGDTVDYTIKTTISANSQYATAIWTDRMTKGLKLKNADTIDNFVDNGLRVEVGGVTNGITDQMVKASIKKTDSKVNENGFALKLDDELLKKINDKERAGDISITLTYTAEITKEAVVDNPLDNTASLIYGNSDSFKSVDYKDNTPVPQNPDEKGTITVTKHFGDGESWPEGSDGKSINFKLLHYDKKAGVWKDEKQSKLTAPDTKLTFDGLTKGDFYKVVEDPTTKGYIPSYEDPTNGNIVITNKTTDFPTPTPPTTVTVVTGGKKFIKVKQGDDTTKLKGAEFNVLSKDKTKVLTAKYEGEEESKKVVDYKWKDVTGGADKSDKPETDESDGYKIVKLTSNKDGEFEITGLNNGEYKLVEIKAPDKYVVPANPYVDFKIELGTYSTTGLNVENKEMFIPATGGIGSAIFVVAGVALMGLAIITINRRRKLN